LCSVDEEDEKKKKNEENSEHKRERKREEKQFSNVKVGSGYCSKRIFSFSIVV